MSADPGQPSWKSLRKMIGQVVRLHPRGLQERPFLVRIADIEVAPSLDGNGSTVWFWGINQ